jgi:hypothetical protein
MAAIGRPRKAYALALRFVQRDPDLAKPTGVVGRFRIGSGVESIKISEATYNELNSDTFMVLTFGLNMAWTIYKRHWRG